MNRSNQTKRTKQAIINSFMDLLNEKQANKIKVSDISKHAEIDRGTFYRYFENKQALIQDCEATLTDKIHFTHKNLASEIQNDEEYSDLSSYINAVLKIIDDNMKMVDTFLNKTGSTSFQRTIADFFVEQITLSLDYMGDEKINDKQKELIANYASSAIIGTIKFWARNYDTYDRHDIVKFLNNVTLNGLINFVK